jgi:hypothetical protein
LQYDDHSRSRAQLHELHVVQPSARRPGEHVQWLWRRLSLRATQR